MIVGRLNKSQDGVIHDLSGEISCLSAGHGNVPKIILSEPLHNSIRSGHDTDTQNGGGNSLTKKHCWDMVKVKQVNPNVNENGWVQQQKRIYDSTGLAPTLSKLDSANNPIVLVKSATQSGYEEAKEGDSINYSMPNSETRRGRVGVAQTLDTQVNQGVLVHNITKTVSVRKYQVDIEKLKQVLKQNRKTSIKEISEKLSIPKTKIEHWFRTDDSFSIPDSDYWFELKNILSITTNEFDESIMTFEEKDNVFEKGNRVYDTKGISPTLTSTQKGEQILAQQIVASRGRGENNEQSLEPNKEGVSNSLTGVQKDNLLMEGYSIRRLTEIECERLQGFPDNWTKYGMFDGQVKEISRTQRYKMCGNAVIVCIVELIGKKLIQAYDTRKILPNKRV